MVEETIQSDGTCFEQFRRVNLIARKQPTSTVMASDSPSARGRRSQGATREISRMSADLGTVQMSVDRVFGRVISRDNSICHEGSSIENSADARNRQLPLRCSDGKWSTDPTLANSV